MNESHLFDAPFPQVALKVRLASFQWIFVFNKCKMAAVVVALAELLTDHLVLRCLSIYQDGLCKQMFGFTTENIPYIYQYIPIYQVGMSWCIYNITYISGWSAGRHRVLNPQTGRCHLLLTWLTPASSQLQLRKRV